MFSEKLCFEVGFSNGGFASVSEAKHPMRYGNCFGQSNSDLSHQVSFRFSFCQKFKLKFSFQFQVSEVSLTLMEGHDWACSAGM